ncbi:hypothetical protein NC652_015363 [Populus alba x Populus x berolinensis]|nr:hypothetical protein NC652_015363 [Populus alba x Populus x berolinensis]
MTITLQRQHIKIATCYMKDSKLLSREVSAIHPCNSQKLKLEDVFTMIVMLKLQLM